MRKFTNQHNISVPMAVWLANDDYDYSDQEKCISVTTLMGSTRSIVLSSRVRPGEYVEDISQRIASSVGTAIHDAIERAWKKDATGTLKALGYPAKLANSVVVNPETVEQGQRPVYLEQRVSREMLGIIVSGKFDMIFDGELNDVKTTKVYNVVSGVNDAAYKLQLSLYRWLNPKSVTKDTGKIQFYMTDWDKHKAGRTKDYPKFPLAQKQIQLMSLSDTENYVRGKIMDLNKYWGVAEPDLPECTREELWQKPPSYKYFAKHGAKRATKVSDSYAEVQGAMAQKGTGYIETVHDEPTKCLYCSAIGNCSQARKFIQAGLITLT